MYPSLQSSSKRLKPISALSPKCKRTFETSSAPIPWTYTASSKAVIPRTAQPGSISESWARKNNRSSYGMGMLAQVICEQLFVFDKSTTRKRPTERARLGQDMHKEFLQVPKTGSPYKPRELPFTTPEEEAAHLFIYVPAAIRTLLTHHKRVEFKLFGHHFGRAFDGSIDEVDPEPKGKAVILKLQEVKTSVGRPLSEESLRRAQLQTSLYVFFLQEMLRREPHFDFEAYFRARGLEPTRAFHPTFAGAFPSHQIPGMNPKGIPPTNLNSLVDQWKIWLNALPEIRIHDNVYVANLQTARISPSPGFGQHPKVCVKSVPHDVGAALRIGQTVIDLLDGNKSPVGLDKKHIRFCLACDFHKRCPWTRELWNRPVQPLRIPIESTLPEAIKRVAPLILAPSPPPSTTPLARPIESISSATIDPAPAMDEKFEAAMRTERHRRKAVLAAIVERMRSNLNPIERKRSAVARELTARKKEEDTLSVVERLRNARLAVARSTIEKRKAAKEARNEARKIEALQTATQRKALRDVIRHQENSATPFSGTVPYVAPTQATTSLKLYKPSLSRVRSKRRQQKQTSVILPRGGQPIPEDVTFSAARLHIPVDNAEKWTYQFDTLPSSSLANQQAAMTRRQEEKNVKQPSRFTDAEMEELAREARRTQRRKDRGK